MKIPPAKQISNFLAADRRRRFGTVGNVTIVTLRVATEKFQDLPEDIDDGNVMQMVHLSSFGLPVDYPSTMVDVLYIVTALTSVRGIDFQ